MRVLITGAGGQLGGELAARLRGAVALGRAELPIDDADAVERALAQHRPELVFNCAAYNAVDRAESEPEAARAVNAAGAENVARACAAAGARLVHFSTNFVFDGRLDRPYVESDAPAPQSAYARSKHEGELRVLEALPGALVVRAAAIFGAGGSAAKGGSFPERILARARAGEPLRVVADQRVNPTYTGDLAGAVLALTESGLTGLVHVVPGDCGSWHELAVEVLGLAGLGDVEVEAVSTEELGAPAARPANGCLGSIRVAPLRPWREGLAAYWAAIQSMSAVDAQPM